MRTRTRAKLTISTTAASALSTPCEDDCEAPADPDDARTLDGAPKGAEHEHTAGAPLSAHDTVHSAAEGHAKTPPQEGHSPSSKVDSEPSCSMPGVCSEGDEELGAADASGTPASSRETSPNEAPCHHFPRLLRAR